MSYYFQFSFLGPLATYYGSLTRVSNGYVIDPQATIKISQGLPASLSRKLESRANAYIQDIRGHDFLSHIGHWVAGDRNGQLPGGANLLTELEQLGQFARPQGSTSRAHNVLLSLGPGPGSFWADNGSRYRWRNLPDDLDDRLQRIICAEKYPSVKDVSINAAGGWVIQHFKGKKYEFGGNLPYRLRQALQKGQDDKKAIAHLHLNHQNEHEYVLIFTDGWTCISLSHEFEDKLKQLYSTIPDYKKHAYRNWNFARSCRCQTHGQINTACTMEEKSKTQAEYYNHRGRFLLRRGHVLQSGAYVELAREYMLEAWRLDHGNKNYMDDYDMSLVAIRANFPDAELERLISQKLDLRQIPSNASDERHQFRLEYLQRVEMVGRSFELGLGLQMMLGENKTDVRCFRAPRPLQWSYSEELRQALDDASESEESRRTSQITELPYEMPSTVYEIQ